MGYAKALWGHFLDILFPPICLACKAYLAAQTEKEYLLCQTCFDGIPIYETVSLGPKFTLVAVSPYDNKALRELLHAFKYDRFLATQIPLASLIDKYLNNVNLSKTLPADTVVVPIPLHRKRLRERGFNQAEVIADIVGECLSFPVISSVFVRIKDTPRQTTRKSKAERLESLRNSFEVIDKETLKGKTIILVDDVYTTGATINEAAKTLRRGGAKNIIGFVVAKTP